MSLPKNIEEAVKQAQALLEEATAIDACAVPTLTALDTIKDWTKSAELKTAIQEATASYRTNQDARYFKAAELLKEVFSEKPTGEMPFWAVLVPGSAGYRTAWGVERGGTRAQIAAKYPGYQGPSSYDGAVKYCLSQHAASRLHDYRQAVNQSRAEQVSTTVGTAQAVQRPKQPDQYWAVLLLDGRWYVRAGTQESVKARADEADVNSKVEYVKGPFTTFDAAKEFFNTPEAIKVLAQQYAARPSRANAADEYYAIQFSDGSWSVRTRPAGSYQDNWCGQVAKYGPFVDEEKAQAYCDYENASSEPDFNVS
jgi:uncharacterized protein YdbL (DUF1318 family)